MIWWQGIARVAGEVAESALPGQRIRRTFGHVPELLASARAQLGNGEVEPALATIQSVLEKEPGNSVAGPVVGSRGQTNKAVYVAPLRPTLCPRSYF